MCLCSQKHDTIFLVCVERFDRFWSIFLREEDVFSLYTEVQFGSVLTKNQTLSSLFLSPSNHHTFYFILFQELLYLVLEVVSFD